MAEKRTVFPLLAFWEACRVAMLVILLHQYLPADPAAAGQAFFFVLLLASGNLIVPAGALYLFLTKKHSAPLILTLCAAKIAGLFTCLLGLGAAVIGFFRAMSAPAPLGTFSLQGMGCLIIFLIDLIFLIRLLSLKVEGGVD